MHCASYTDLTEAFKVGELALIHAAEGETGKMVAINRDSNEPYTVSYSLVDSDKVANHVSYFPSEWINEAGNFVTEEAYSYFKPLIKDLPNLALKGNLPKYKVFNQ